MRRRLHCLVLFMSRLLLLSAAGRSFGSVKVARLLSPSHSAFVRQPPCQGFEGRTQLRNICTARPVLLMAARGGGLGGGTESTGALDSLTMEELKTMLRDKGLKVGGKKSELIERLQSQVKAASVRSVLFNSVSADDLTLSSQIEPMRSQAKSPRVAKANAPAASRSVGKAAAPVKAPTASAPAKAQNAAASAKTPTAGAPAKARKPAEDPPAPTKAPTPASSGGTGGMRVEIIACKS
jgi:hypothetical protein